MGAREENDSRSGTGRKASPEQPPWPTGAGGPTDGAGRVLAQAAAGRATSATDSAPDSATDSATEQRRKQRRTARRIGTRTPFGPTWNPLAADRPRAVVY
ncbi:hypothetical protein GCM10012280_26230 [Wenjunlia tyrosinilytica]|uniref:Uncharacterized protein n=1 Tax=Wenjunlia tyrosinilytica TaxID=1544741 RepID=A0A917ZMV9_9ACTN|nr:hypothetical protein GCM10012280_26230 [Wenjunlia tyrosinilytica]